MRAKAAFKKSAVKFIWNLLYKLFNRSLIINLICVSSFTAVTHQINHQQKQMKHTENKGFQLHMEPAYNFSRTSFQRVFFKKTYQLLTTNTSKKHWILMSSH